MTGVQTCALPIFASRYLPENINPLLRLGLELGAGAAGGLAGERLGALSPGALRSIDTFLGEAPAGYISPSQQTALRSEVFPGVERIAKTVLPGPVRAMPSPAEEGARIGNLLRPRTLAQLGPEPEVRNVLQVADDLARQVGSQNVSLEIGRAHV